MRALQAKKESIIAKLVASLPQRLGANGAELLHRHVTDRVKRKVKIRPDDDIPQY